MRLHLVAAVVLVSSALVWGGESEKPAAKPGETEVPSGEIAKTLAALPAFKDPQPLKARIRTEVDDLLGARVEEGELLLDRPARVLRKFNKPSPKQWLLSGAQIQEFAPKAKTLYVKDFSQAPRALKLVQAAFTGDLQALSELFDIHTFKSAAEDKTLYRFVLTRKAGDGPAIYKRIEARLFADGLFFHELEYLPEAGDRVLEKYLDIAAVPKPEDAAFNLELPADVTRKVEKVGKEGEGK